MIVTVSGLISQRCNRPDRLDIPSGDQRLRYKTVSFSFLFHKLITANHPRFVAFLESEFGGVSQPSDAQKQKVVLTPFSEQQKRVPGSIHRE